MYAPDVGWWHAAGVAQSQPQLPTAQQLYDCPFFFSSYKPEEIACVSRVALSVFPDDIRNKRYLRSDAPRLSNVSFDLMRGFYDKYIRATSRRSERAITHILKWWLANEGQPQAAPGRGVSSPRRPMNFDFVFRRGHLAKVLVTPYSQNEWKIAVTLFRGTYFLLELRDDEDFTEAGDRIDYMGHKFEQYMTSARPGQAPDPSEVMDMNEAFYSLVTATLKSHSMLLCAEVDSEDPAVCHQRPPASYVELKTSPLRGPPSSVSSMKKLRWWAQSYLGGVPRILVGFKSDDHTVVACSMFHVSYLGVKEIAPRAMMEPPDFWKPAVCMNFLDAFLSFVKQVVTEDNYEVVYVFSWRPHDNVSYQVKRGLEHCFLLPEYVQRVTALYR